MSILTAWTHVFCSCSFCLFTLLPFSLLGAWPLASQVGDGVGTNLADINFQDAQAGRKLLVKPAEL